MLTSNVKTSRKAEESKSASRSRSSSNVDESKPNEQEERLKKSYEEFMSVVKATQTGAPVPPLPKIAQLNLQKELFSSGISQSSLKKLKHVKCIESIEFSSSNSVTEDRKIQGDLFYLTVKTLESPAYE